MGTGKKKIEIQRRETPKQRMVAFSKRRKGLFKKADELRRVTGADVGVLVFSPAGRPYVNGDPSFDAIVDRYQRTVQQSNDDDNVADYGDETSRCRRWLEAIEVEAFNDVDELLGLKKELEEIREKVAKTR
ncbi:hypothetical protein F0562_009004 [Nyssa sinensis]|uniref:MADS-box domain-containing protein n=1 Tax=Nyssa sinensis TaxID=561372 RepID=A0A5J5ABD9_9ASTE|nr:hypothetical protein F0562_009004 [Nyssa sinensis]